MQHAVHAPFVQQSEAGQSVSAQHAALMHEPPQHFWPPGHCASVVQAQFTAPHSWVATLQHWSARQSAFVQQVPGTHSRRSEAVASPVATTPPSACTASASGVPTVPSARPASAPAALLLAALLLEEEHPSRVTPTARSKSERNLAREGTAKPLAPLLNSCPFLSRPHLITHRCEYRRKSGAVTVGKPTPADAAPRSALERRSDRLHGRLPIVVEKRVPATGDDLQRGVGRVFHDASAERHGRRPIALADPSRDRNRQFV